jgi:two-component system sensor histidine kinase CreC
MEETLIDTSVLLASVLETQIVDGVLDAGGLERALGTAKDRRFTAKIFSLEKTSLDVRVYVTDATGRVIYDSNGADLGKDFSQWNDVKRTLRGEYGARSSRTIVGDDNTQSLYVAAPIRHADKIVGVLTVGKPTRGVNELVAVAKRRVLTIALAGGLAILLLLLVAASWVIAPLERLTGYARAVRDGRPVAVPKLPGRTLQELGVAFEEMRDALDGRKQLERYTQVMAHELKAPLAAIRGAAELLGEPMSDEQRRKFLENIRGESARIQQIVDRLLELSSLEARKALQQAERLVGSELAGEAMAAVAASFEAKRVRLQKGEGNDFVVTGERVLLREALVNLLQNALDFTPTDGTVTVSVTFREGRGMFTIADTGVGIPDYALSRVTERFYSLPRPGSARKSTGLGLTMVQEIAHLHGGDVRLANREGGGACATLSIPATGG